jgi:hypothetical protein
MQRENQLRPLQQPLNQQHQMSQNRPSDSESCTGFLGRLVGITILLPFAFLAYIIAWTTFSLIGVIIFIGFPFAAIFLDTIRWVATNYNDPKPNPEYLANRLKKGALIIINTFEIMAELKRTEYEKPTSIPTTTETSPV